MDNLVNKSLLYAEDDPITKQLYEAFFNQFFGTVYGAENGKQALELYHSKKPDVVILDINMPYLNGLELCKKIQ